VRPSPPTQQQQQQRSAKGAVGKGGAAFQQAVPVVASTSSASPCAIDPSTLRARCLAIDLEEGVLNSMMKGPLRSLFDSTHFISDVSGAGNNWAVGHMEFGDKHIEGISDSLRLLVEKCDCIQTFLVMHSLGGGTGSGLGTRVLGMLEEDFPHVFRFAVTVMPSEVDDVVTAPYNTCFALKELIEHADCVIPLDNDALARVVDKAHGRSSNSRQTDAPVASGGFNVADPTRTKGLPFDDMNAICAQMLSNLTCSMRFPGSLNMDMNEVTTNMIPYPRLHLLTSAIAPLALTKQSATGARNLDAMFSACLDRDHQLVTYANSAGKRARTLAAALIARGPNFTVGDLSRNVVRIHERLDMVYWNADGFKTALCDVAPLGQPNSLLMLSNNCAISSKIQTIQERFMKLYSVKSHVHHYTPYVELAYFDKATNVLRDVVEDYEYLNTVEAPPQGPRSLRDLLAT
jgi:tubulin epsilon